eukprot:COSAG01_NODE_61948_length_287_cov_0.611702_1_plen_32_part_10
MAGSNNRGAGGGRGAGAGGPSVLPRSLSLSLC